MDLLIGIAIGAAFSPFWIKLYHIGKALVFKSKPTDLK
jgi:hypothetical protein